MDIRPIRSDEDHAAALRMIEKLWGAPAGTPRADKLDILATLVDAYESRHFAMLELDPIDAIKAHMDLSGYSQADLAALLGGSRSRASEILNRKRALNIHQVHRISQGWKIPAELLVRPYPLERRVA